MIFDQPRHVKLTDKLHPKMIFGLMSSPAANLAERPFRVAMSKGGALPPSAKDLGCAPETAAENSWCLSQSVTTAIH